jgi:hypothetical protein
VIFRDGCCGLTLHPKQVSAKQATNAVLHCALRQARGIGHHLVTQAGAFDATAKGLAPEVEINQESGGRMIVPHQVAHEHVQNIVVDGHIVIITIVIDTIDIRIGLQLSGVFG